LDEDAEAATLRQTGPHQTRYAENAVEQCLAENLQCCSAFTGWFIRQSLRNFQMDIAIEKTTVDRVRADGDADGGHDLRVVVDLGLIRLALLVAIRFAHRPSLARRAREAAAQMAASGKAAIAASVWLTTAAAAAEATGADLGYDQVVTLDSVIRELRHEAACAAYELKRRREFQVELLEAAAGSAAAASAAPADGRDAFWTRYVALVADRAPTLGIEEARMAQDTARGMLVFDPDTLPRWSFMPVVRLAHHLREGIASILIHDWGEDIDGLAQVMQPAMDGTRYHLTLAPGRFPGAKPGVMIVAETPALDPSAPFDGQRRAAMRCVAEIDALRGWFASRKGVARYWSDFVTPTPATEGPTRVRRDLKLG
jgi:hypothetical protein